MPDVLIRNVSDRTLIALKRRAKFRHVPLQEELRAILDEAARTTMFDAESTARRISQNLRKKGIHFADSGELQAQDRLR